MIICGGCGSLAGPSASALSPGRRGGRAPRAAVGRSRGHRHGCTRPEPRGGGGRRRPGEWESRRGEAPSCRSDYPRNRLSLPPFRWLGRQETLSFRANSYVVSTGEFETDHPSTAYLVLTLKLSEEAANVPVIDVIRAVRTAAVGLAASRGQQPAGDEVEQAARRHLGLAG